jgi:hypothetical protein
MEQQSIKLLKAQVADLQKQIKLLQNQERQNKRQLLKVRNQQKEQKQILKIQDETYKAIVQLFTQNTPKKYKHAPRKGKSLFKPTKNAILAVRRKK